MKDLIYGAEPAVAIFADSDEGLARAAACVAAAGARLAMRATIAEALDLLNERPADAVLVEASRDGGAPLDRLLERLDVDAASGRLRSVVVVTPELVDVAAARTSHDDVTLVCGGGATDCVAALGLALMPRELLVFEERGDDASMQLRRVREEVARIARTLAAVAAMPEERAPAPPPPPAATAGAPADPPMAPTLRALIRARRLREQFFDPELFADPAWDMLLDLTLARTEGRSVAVSSLCIAAAVPPTTALRWIKRLTDDGLFTRVADPLDGRRVFIELSEAGAVAMMRYLRANAPPARVVE